MVKKYVCIPRSFLIINVCNQGKTLCSPCISNKVQRYTVYYIWKLLYMFRVELPPIIRSTCNCICSIWYLSHRYCYLPLSPTIAAGSSNGVTNTRCCRYSFILSWWWVEVPPETCRAVSRYNKLCNVASCWICIGISLLYSQPRVYLVCCVLFVFSNSNHLQGISLVVTPSSVVTSRRKPASVGISHKSCGVKESDEINAL